MRSWQGEWIYSRPLPLPGFPCLSQLPLCLSLPASLPPKPPQSLVLADLSASMISSLVSGRYAKRALQLLFLRLDCLSTIYCKCF